jgi:transposase
MMSDQGSHFLNDTIWELTQDFMIHHQNKSPYHPQANGMVELSIKF